MKALPRLNIKRIDAFAEYAKTAIIPPPLNFYSFMGRDGKEIVASDMYPQTHAPGVIDFFFFAMIHNYGFWTDDGMKYLAPVHGVWDGKGGVKGSDLLWRMLCAAWKKDALCFAPERLATISCSNFAIMFSDDNGAVPFFNTQQRIRITRDYGRWFRVKRMAGQSPSALLAYANDHDDSVHVLRSILTHPESGIPGLYEDPLGKKAELLLMALAGRPEKFLRFGAVTKWLPIVDYHDMRLTLRLGHVVLPKAWVTNNELRFFTLREHEEEIRKATYRADELVIAKSGRTRDEIDFLKWSARRYCPEMEAPNCAGCALKDVCARKTNLFQPVLRTTFY